MDPAAALDALIARPGFPCVGAKAARARGSVYPLLARSMRHTVDDARITAALQGFGRRCGGHLFVSLAVIFRDDEQLDETAFEAALWARLQAIHDIDAQQFAWDDSVSSDPASPHFSMSVGGRAYYVVGLHPRAHRAARRFVHPALVFNPHRQFERLRDDGRYAKMCRTTAVRDIAYSGSVNPMLADHGVSSEAAQYSGRRVASGWRCPLRPHLGRPRGHRGADRDS